jgi:hypothetical protein
MTASGAAASTIVCRSVIDDIGGIIGRSIAAGIIGPSIAAGIIGLSIAAGIIGPSVAAGIIVGTNVGKNIDQSTKDAKGTKERKG